MHLITGAPTAISPPVTNAGESVVDVAYSPNNSLFCVLTRLNLQFWSGLQHCIHLATVPLPKCSLLPGRDVGASVVWHQSGKLVAVTTVDRRVMLFEADIMITDNTSTVSYRPNYRDFRLVNGASRVALAAEVQLDYGLFVSVVPTFHYLLVATSGGFLVAVQWTTGAVRHVLSTSQLVSAIFAERVIGSDAAGTSAAAPATASTSAAMMGTSISVTSAGATPSKQAMGGGVVASSSSSHWAKAYKIRGTITAMTFTASGGGSAGQSVGGSGGGGFYDGCHKMLAIAFSDGHVVVVTMDVIGTEKNILFKLLCLPFVVSGGSAGGGGGGPSSASSGMAVGGHGSCERMAINGRHKLLAVACNADNSVKLYRLPVDVLVQSAAMRAKLNTSTNTTHSNNTTVSAAAAAASGGASLSAAPLPQPPSPSPLLLLPPSLVETSGQLALDEPRDLKRVNGLRWSDDGETVCAHYAHHGLALIDRSGAVTMTSFSRFSGCGFGVRGVPSLFPGSCDGVTWGCHGTRLIACDAITNYILIFNVSRAMEVGSASGGGQGGAVLLSADGVASYEASDSEGLADSWEQSAAPRHYLAANYPLRHGAVSSSGDDVCVGGHRGVAIYSRSACRWKTFSGGSKAEALVACVGPPHWINDAIVAVPVRRIVERRFAVLLFSKNAFDLSTVLAEIPLKARCVMMASSPRYSANANVSANAGVGGAAATPTVPTPTITAVGEHRIILAMKDSLDQLLLAEVTVLADQLKAPRMLTVALAQVRDPIDLDLLGLGGGLVKMAMVPSGSTVRPGCGGGGSGNAPVAAGDVTNKNVAAAATAAAVPTATALNSTVDKGVANGLALPKLLLLTTSGALSMIDLGDSVIVVRTLAVPMGGNAAGGGPSAAYCGVGGGSGVGGAGAFGGKGGESSMMGSSSSDFIAVGSPGGLSSSPNHPHQLPPLLFGAHPSQYHSNVASTTYNGVFPSALLFNFWVDSNVAAVASSSSSPSTTVGSALPPSPPLSVLVTYGPNGLWLQPLYADTLTQQHQHQQHQQQAGSVSIAQTSLTVAAAAPPAAVSDALLLPYPPVRPEKGHAQQLGGLLPSLLSTAAVAALPIATATARHLPMYLPKGFQIAEFDADSVPIAVLPKAGQVLCAASSVDRSLLVPGIYPLYGVAVRPILYQHLTLLGLFIQQQQQLQYAASSIAAASSASGGAVGFASSSVATLNNNSSVSTTIGPLVNAGRGISDAAAWALLHRLRTSKTLVETLDYLLFTAIHQPLYTHQGFGGGTLVVPTTPHPLTAQQQQQLFLMVDVSPMSHQSSSSLQATMAASMAQQQQQLRDTAHVASGPYVASLSTLASPSPESENSSPFVTVTHQQLGGGGDGGAAYPSVRPTAVAAATAGSNTMTASSPLSFSPPHPLDLRQLLQIVMATLRTYPVEYYQVITGCVRKVDSSKWGHIFKVVGTPRAYYDRCLQRGYLKEAAQMVRVVLMDSPPEEAPKESLEKTLHCAKRLFVAALEAGEDVLLAYEVLRFMALLSMEIDLPPVSPPEALPTSAIERAMRTFLFFGGGAAAAALASAKRAQDGLSSPTPTMLAPYAIHPYDAGSSMMASVAGGHFNGSGGGGDQHNHNHNNNGSSSSANGVAGVTGVSGGDGGQTTPIPKQFSNTRLNAMGLMGGSANNSFGGAPTCTTNNCSNNAVGAAATTASGDGRALFDGCTPPALVTPTTTPTSASGPAAPSTAAAMCAVIGVDAIIASLSSAASSVAVLTPSNVFIDEDGVSRPEVAPTLYNLLAKPGNSGLAAAVVRVAARCLVEGRVTLLFTLFDMLSLNLLHFIAAVWPMLRPAVRLKTVIDQLHVEFGLPRGQREVDALGTQLAIRRCPKLATSVPAVEGTAGDGVDGDLALAPFILVTATQEHIAAMARTFGALRALSKVFGDLHCDVYVAALAVLLPSPTRLAEVTTDAPTTATAAPHPATSSACTTCAAALYAEVLDVLSVPVNGGYTRLREAWGRLVPREAVPQQQQQE